MGKNNPGQNANRKKANKFTERSSNFERLEELQLEAAKRGIELEELEEQLANEEESKSNGSDSDGESNAQDSNA